MIDLYNPRCAGAWDEPACSRCGSDDGCGDIPAHAAQTQLRALAPEYFPPAVCE